MTDKGELHGLAEYKIVELDLNAKTGTEVDHGNLIGRVSGYRSANGDTHLNISLGDVLAAPAVDVLPRDLTAAGGHVPSAATHIVHSTGGAVQQALVRDNENKHTPLI